ncbi:FAD-dependent oxidoreductase [Mycolicibacterium stellerae]|uniref:FAD-dependent oxidoreductase n=1 Tax=Mycolicibacterium stellerae TaxID=2358193 RepID=UPI000F0BD281|nr:FAD-dependent oxidoreductase [Mycolicibacterium stellerae]
MATRDLSGPAPAYEPDVLVVGGGPAGVAAAIGAARTGARVQLVEQHGFLGGTAIASSVLTYCGFFDRSHSQVVAGVGQLFLDELARAERYRTHVTQESGNKVVLLDAETTKRALDALVCDHGVPLALHTTLTAAEVRDGLIREVEVSHLGHRERIRAAGFVDATGDGVLLAAVGAARVVRPPQERQASTLVMRFGGVHGDASLSADAMREAVITYRSRQNVDLPRDHGAMVRLPITGEVMVLAADHHADVLTVEGHTRAEIDSRRAAAHYLSALREGMPGWECSFLVATGPALGVRETRHMAGKYQLTGEDVATGRRQPDHTVARGGWPMEDHSQPGVTSHRGIRSDSWYDIPYGTIESSHHENLWAAGRLVDADAMAYSSVRVMGTAFATGHAAGVAAALYAGGNSALCTDVQHELRAQGALL